MRFLRSSMVVLLSGLSLILSGMMVASFFGAQLHNQYSLVRNTRFEWGISHIRSVAALHFYQLPEAESKSTHPRIAIGKFGYWVETDGPWHQGLYNRRHILRVPSIVLLATLLAYPALVLMRFMRRVIWWLYGQCPWCRYDLQGQSGPLCPECGERVPRLPVAPADRPAP